MLDIAIGTIFVHLLLSLVCSSVNELVERPLKNRAADLEEGLRELLDDKTGEGLVTGLYQHEMVNGLFKGDYNTKDTSNLPSYIPSRNFALAIMSIVASKGPAGNIQSAVGKYRALRSRMRS